MKTKLFILGLAAVTLVSCGDDFLNRHPEGGTLLEDQYQQLDDAVEGSIMGIYSLLYNVSDHDAFGQRSIDMYGDITSGDMAMKTCSYGWYEMYERGYFYLYGRSYHWSFYYDIIRLCNNCVGAVEEVGVPDIPSEGDEVAESDAKVGYYYGQVMALRGWAYSNLVKFYTPSSDEIDIETEPAIPVYTEVEVKENVLGAARSTVAEVYERIYEDMSTGVGYLAAFGPMVQRKSKLEIDADGARVLLAYAMLNKGTKESYGQALKYAKEAIDNGKYPMLPLSELTTTGFADVNSTNWMWGNDVITETTGALASFFGQVDIHTYSYAWAGDFKGIDSKLYDEIIATGWDARKDWFNDGTKTGYAKFKYAPDGKFFCPATKNTLDSKSIDRDWLCDNVFLRIETAYLIAAEACYHTSDYTEAQNYLNQLTDQRAMADSTAQKAYTDYKAGLSNADNLKAAIIYNWRVEMWGEGYALQTLRRLSKEVTLGENHLSRAGTTLKGSDENYLLEIPSSETRYNPFIGSTTTLKDK